MDLRDYLAIRRAYNLVRQDSEKQPRLAFAEFAMLCHMDALDVPVNTSSIAEYQGVLRPTMTHRTKHLADLGLLRREDGASDRRNIFCSITDEGHELIDGLSKQVCLYLRGGKVLSRTTSRRICQYVDAMGGINVMARELVLLGILKNEGQATVGTLVTMLGLLQPTVSMSAASLAKDGLVQREEGRSHRSVGITLTEEGRVQAEAIREKIESLNVHR